MTPINDVVSQCNRTNDSRKKSGLWRRPRLRQSAMPQLPNATTSPRLVLRAWTTEDVPAVGEAIMASLDHLLPWMPWAAFEPAPPGDRIALFQRWNREWLDGGDAVFGIFAAGGGTLPAGAVLGGAGLHRRIGPDGLEIGYWVHAAHARQGIATEAARALTDLAFTVTGIERVEIHHDRNNVASGGVPRTLGYSRVGELPRDVTAPGECGVLVSWRVTRHDWLVRRTE